MWTFKFSYLLICKLTPSLILALEKTFSMEIEKGSVILTNSSKRIIGEDMPLHIC